MLKRVAILLLIMGLTTSCSTIKPLQNVDTNNINVTISECGSYEFKNKDRIMGYLVNFQPDSIIDKKKVKEIIQFEKILNKKFKYKFKKRYRVYNFYENRKRDTLLFVIFLKLRHTKSIANWKCRIQDVETYWPHNDTVFYYLFDPKDLEYNCSKNRFMIPSVDED